MTTRQRRALEQLIARCREVDPSCGIQLQGSVSRGEEREDSDVDLTVLLTLAELPRENALLNATNRGRMIRTRDEALGLNVDVNWLSEQELIERVDRHGALDWYMFLVGETVHDPAGAVARCRARIARWYDDHPRALRAWQQQHVELSRRRRDPTHPLEFETQPAFVAHLIERQERS